jgi:hypothetical protein
MEIDLTEDAVICDSAIDDEMLEEENMDIPEKSPQAEQQPVAEENTLDYFISDNPTVLELARVSWANQKYKQRYLRGCSWSPDGTW